ncbi:helix-turn-helix transcriptional regulator [Massilia sp. SR12]
MPKATLPTFPIAFKQLANLGERLRLARRRRKITAVLFAERMGVSRETLRRLEKGDPTIAIGTYLRALRVLGLDDDIDSVARDDKLGRKLQDIALLG